MELREIHCYTNLLLENSKVHVPYLTFYLELASDGHNTVLILSVISVQ